MERKLFLLHALHSLSHACNGKRCINVLKQRTRQGEDTSQGITLCGFSSDIGRMNKSRLGNEANWEKTRNMHKISLENFQERDEY